MGQSLKQNNPKMFPQETPQNLPSRQQPQPTAGDRGDLQPINPIRTETIFTKFPIHNLSTRRSLSPIRLIKRTPSGQIETYWKVSPHQAFGEPGHLAYKIDKLVVDLQIDQTPRPLPRYIRLGSLREIARQVGLRDHDTPAIKKALLQNATAFITAKFTYTTRDGASQRVERDFIRYDLVFWDQKLPDGTLSDAVYIQLHDPYYLILNNTRPRPLDYTYKKQLTPKALRFYELVSFHIFGAIHNNRLEAKLRYSEYCSQVPQKQHLSRQPAQNQMNKLHQPHLRSGYITKVRWQRTTDEQGGPDWLIYYTPGARAYAEYETFSGTKSRISTPKAFPIPAEVGETPQPKIDKKLLSQLKAHGITETEAYKVLSDISEQQKEYILDCLDYVDQIPTDRQTNPAGLLLSFIHRRHTFPETFLTRAQRRQLQAEREAQEHENSQQQWLDTLYRDYERHTIREWVKTNVPEPELTARIEKAKATLRPVHQGKPSKTLDTMAFASACSYYRERVPLVTFDAFKQDTTAQQKTEARLKAPDDTPNTQEAEATPPEAS